VHEELNRRLQHYLASETIDDLFEKVLDRIESDNTAETVRVALEVLWAAKESFAEDELLTVSQLPPAVWAPIHIALDESLIGADGRLAFSHDYLRKAVEDRYLNLDQDRHRIKQRMAEFCAQAMAESRKEISHYVRRHAVEHFLEVEDWDNATAALSDLDFIEARAIAQELPAILKDYAEAVKLIPEGEKERQTEAARQAELDRYAKEMYEYSAAWSRMRDGSGEAEPQLPRPVESVRLWTEEEIVAERKRMTETPNRLDIVKAFRVFVATNSAPLQQYSTQEGFAANLARNDAPAGPVHEEGKRRLEPLKCIKLIKQFTPEEVYNPLPACEALLEGNGRFSGCFEMLSISFDGKRLVAVQRPDNSSIIWSINTTTGKQFKIYEGTFFDVSSLLLNPSGTAVYGGMENGEICVWNADSGELIGVLKGHSGSVNCISLSSDGQRLISGGDDKIIRLWNCKLGQCIGILAGHISPVKSVAFSANGQRAVSASDDKTIRIWDIFSNQCLNIFEEYKDVSATVLNSNGSKLAAVCSDELIFWDLDSAKIIQKIQSEFEGNAFDESPFKINASADGVHLISGSSIGVQFWDIMTGACCKVFDVNPAEFLAASANCHHFVICFNNHIVKILDANSAITLKELSGFTSYVGNAILSGNGLRLVTLHLNNEIRFWDLEKSYLSKFFERHDGQVRSIILDNEKRIFLSSCDNESWVWDIKTGKLLEKKLIELEERVFLSPDGLHCACWDNSNEDTTEIIIWDKKTEKIIKELKIHNGEIHKIIITADCKRIISQSDCGEIRVWDLFSEKCLRVFNDASKEKRPFLLSPDDTKIIFSRRAGLDDLIHVVDVNSGEELMRFEGFLNVVTSLELSPDGRFLFSGGWSDEIILWDAIVDQFISLFKFNMLCRFKIDWIQKKLCAGDANGRVEFYNIENLPLGPFIATAHREIISEDLPAGAVTARPACCGQLISISSTIADRIEYWALDGGEGGYTDPALLLDCPSCATPLRMNPFFVDVKPTNA
jgi:WD40 repeat protein